MCDSKKFEDSSLKSEQDRELERNAQLLLTARKSGGAGDLVSSFKKQTRVKIWTFSFWQIVESLR